MNTDLYRTDLPQVTQKIACLIPKGIRTAIFATPALQAIRQRYPTAQMTLIIDKETYLLFNHWPEFHQVIALNHYSIWLNIKTYLKLALEPFDLLIDLYTPYSHIQDNNEFNSGSKKQLYATATIRQHLIIGSLIHAKKSIGFSINPTYYGNTALRWLKKHARFSINIPSPKPDILRQENIANLMLRLIIDQKKISIAAPIFKQEIRYENDYKALDIIKHHRQTMNHKANCIGFFFGGHHLSQHWPLNHVIEFTKKLTQSLQVQLHIFGGAHESRYIHPIHEQLQKEIQDGSVINHIQDFNLLETTAQISQCSIMVSTLGGPLAIADTLNIPLITLATSSVHSKNKSARQTKQILLNTPTTCSPCFLTHCNQPISCQEQTTPTQLLEAIHHMISDSFYQVHH